MSVQRDIRLGLSMLAMAVMVNVGAAVMSAAAERPYPFEGKWTIDPASCRDPEGVNWIVITPLRVTGYEHACDFRKVSGNGHRFVVLMDCSGEGRKWRETQVFTVRGAAMRIESNLTSRVQNFQRCP